VQAYLDCRRTKRNSASALAFEAQAERNLFELHEELASGRYTPGRSICFVITRPRPREVWAAEFRDRIAHHLLYNHIGPRFLARFTADSCACIPGRGTLYAAQRLDHQVRSITMNWSQPAHYLKCDLANFFVSIDKTILLEQLRRQVHEPWWMALAEKILMHDPRRDVEVRGTRRELALVPPHKSLFNAPNHHGLPIGNLSSQFFANVLLDELDQHIKHRLCAPVLAKRRQVDPKTQTRRAMRVQPPEDCSRILCGPYHPTVLRRGEEEPGPEVFGAYSEDGAWALRCPYGRPGDRLWVRETHFAFGRWETRFSAKKGRDEWHFSDMTPELGLSYRYAADSDELPHMLGRQLAGGAPMWWKRPAIFMSRSASRITLESTEVRVQRLQDISDADAHAEGIEPLHVSGTGRQAWRMYPHTDGVPGEEVAAYCGRPFTFDPIESYKSLWLSINGPGSWDANPLVWAITFKETR
jgi:hypothetical protein